MRPFIRIPALALLAILGIAQSGLPAFFGEAWARSAMFLEYQKVMSRTDAVRLVLDGDLGCGYFTELEELNEKAGAVTLAWVTSEPPLLLLGSAERNPIPYPKISDIGINRRSDSSLQNQAKVEPPPPRLG